MTPDGLASGFLIGIVVAVVVGFLLSLISGWIRLSNEPNQRQAIVHVTEETPNQVVRTARLASWSLFVFVAFFGLLGWTWFADQHADAAATVQRIIVQLLVWALDGVIGLLELLRAVLAGLV